MELKYYDKPWLPAIKGAFLIIFGIVAMLNIMGTIKSLAVFFAFLIAMIGVLLIVTGVRYKKSSFRGWTIASGIINLVFCAVLFSKVDTAKSLYEAREGIVLLMLIWAIFFAITEIVEAALLVTLKNAFAALFLINGLLTLLFAYFLNVVSLDFTPQKVFYLGALALVTGIVNELSAYLLNQVKQS
jgi:uncharacterized membrane protein HdeD (DUF308 family)